MKPSVLYVARTDGSLVAVAPSAREALGWDLPAGSAPEPGLWLAHLHPDDRPAALAARQRALAEGSASCEYRLRRGDGSFARVRDEAHAFANGGESLVHGSWTVVEGAPGGELGARELEAIRLSFERSSVGEAFVDAQGRVCRANAAFRRFLGREPADVLGRPLDELIHPDDAVDFRERIDGLLRGESTQLRTEVRFARMGGWVVWADASVSRLGEPTDPERELLLQTSDVTDQRLAFDLLRLSEKRLATALAAAQAGLWDWDLATGAVNYSRVWKSIVGYAEEELEGRIETFERLVHPDDLASVRGLMRDHLDGRTDKYEARFRMLHKSGRTVTILSRGSILRDPTDGSPSHFVGTHVDLSEREAREQSLREARDAAEAASRAKGVFIASMSHELRTPLNSVIGFSELLGIEVAARLDDRQREWLDTIRTSALHLLAVLNDIIEIAAIEAGRTHLRLEQVPLAIVVDATRASFERAAVKAGVTFEVSIPPGLPDLRIDRLRMKQVLANLLSNAVKFTPRGGRVTLRARQAGDRVEIAVQDTGIGIRQEDQDRLFHDFEQLDQGSGRSKHEGTGLGLALARRLVEMHHGTISAESEPGQGSTFTVSLPITPPPEASAAQAHTDR